MCLNNLGLGYSSLGDFRKAKELLSRCIQIKARVLPSSSLLNTVLQEQNSESENSPEVASVLNNLGTACFLLQEYEQAVGHLSKACAIARRQLGAKHTDTQLYTANWRAARAAFTATPQDQHDQL